MIWCETACPDARGMDRLAVFVSQVNALGLEAGIDVRAVPGNLARTIRFDIAPYLLDRPLESADRVALIAADEMTDAKLVELRRLLGGESRACIAFGRFESRQQLIGVTAKLSYIFNREPVIINLEERGSPGSGFGGDPVFGAPRRLGAWRGPASDRVRLLIARPALDDPAQVAALSVLALSRQLDLAVLTDGETKKSWQSARGTELTVYNFGEILPVDLVERADILVCMTPLQANYRLQCLVANAAAAGVTLLDGTPDGANAAVTDAFVRAPWDLVGLRSFLRDEVLPNVGQLGAHARASLPRSCSGALAKQVLQGQGDPDPKPSRPIAVAPGPEPAGGLVFVPTNGVGLGHAQRCTLVAAELDRDRVDPVFAAFPSCVGMVKEYGFNVMPLVQRSPLHLETYANDIVNYVRLKALTAGARALVFDGGYVFDSIFRAIVENRLAGVWLRRGLWQEEQDNSLALDRAKVFSRIIVPSEAFDELNDPRSENGRVQHVGPIVRRLDLALKDRNKLRRQLARRYDLDFDRLVVTQLGGGVAADRGPQIQALCGMMERRSDVLHLVVAWPTAAVQPGWFGWSRSRVVRTRHAGVLAASADLCISAAGYNSFHEILYGALPAILIPQMGKGMDDQMARARAARDRDLVGLVEPHRLVALERLVSRFLDDGEAEASRQRLSAIELPPVGNRRAALLIEELMNEGAALGRPRVADRSSGSR